MQSRLSIKTRAWIYILSYMGVTLLVSLTILAGSYFWFAARGMRNDLENVATEMVTNRLTYDGNSIKFKLDSEGRTLSGYLRDENMSAEIIDENGLTIAKYGVFQNVDELDNYDRNNQKNMNSELVTKDGERYMTLYTPILYQGDAVGRLVLAIPMLVLGHFSEISIGLMLAVLLLSMLLSWPLSHELVKIVFKSVDELVGAMEKVEIKNLKQKIDYSGNENDEIGILVRSFNKLLDRLAQGVEKQKSFISNASHELKTPLARMVSTLEIMKIDENDEPKIKLIDEVKGELMNLSTKVDGLLLLSRYDQSEQKQSYEYFSPKNVVESTLLKYSVEIEKKGIIIDKTLFFDEKIRGDKVGFELVTSNLISNAIKYNRQSGGLKIRVYSETGLLKVVISDEGVGIDKNYFEKIFDRFSRNEKTANLADGFGVGMSLVSQVCERNGWSIKYDENYKNGTCVELAIWL